MPNLSYAKIYKYIDTKGKVHFTDRKPADDDKYKEIEFRKNAKVETKSSIKKEKTKQDPFSDFEITTPKENEKLSNTKGYVMATVKINGNLSRSYRIKFYIDKLPHGKVKSTSQLIADIEKGPHTIYAEIIEARSREVIKTTDTINFTTLD